MYELDFLVLDGLDGFVPEVLGHGLSSYSSLRIPESGYYAISQALQ
jgi:hypothetical protein